MLSNLLILELKEILNTEFELKLTNEEVEKIANFLVGYFSALVKVE